MNKQAVLKDVYSGAIYKSLKLLSKNDRIKVLLLVFIQISLSLFDLAGVAAIGMIGALTINGTSSQQPGDRVSRFLEILQIDNFSLTKQVAVLGIFAATLLVSKTLSTIYLTRRTMFFLGNRAALITQELIYKILNQSLQEIQKRSIQENVYLVSGGVTNITNGIIASLISLVADSFLLVTMLIGLYFVDPLVATLTILIFGGIALMLYLLTQVRAKTLASKQTQLSIRSIEMIHEVIGSFRQAVIGGRRTFYSQEIGKHQSVLARSQAELSFLPTISKYVLEITIVLGFLIISTVTFSQNNAPRSIAIISIFLASSTRIGPAILRIQQVAILIKSSSSAASPTLILIDRLNKQKIIRDKPNQFTRYHNDFLPMVNINNLQFTYEGNSSPTLKDINLEVNPGETLALVGKSGSGKSTLADLIIGVLSPEVGEVKISNLASSKVPNIFPGAIAYVPQDIFIINGSIRSNICLGFNNNEISDDEIWEALSTAQIFDVVDKLPNKLETLIGDRGSKLSGGQRQRLGIARALITKPKLLILDEATSSLDSQTELEISESIFDLGKDVTIIIIAHRLSTVKKSKLVAYLENGRIVSIGTFDQVRKSVPNFDLQARLLGI